MIASIDDGAGEDLDPRVEGALGRLNTATDDINRSEKDLDAAKKAFKKGMAQIQVDLAAMLSKVWRCSYHTCCYLQNMIHTLHRCSWKVEFTDEISRHGSRECMCNMMWR